MIMPLQQTITKPAGGLGEADVRVNEVRCQHAVVVQ